MKRTLKLSSSQVLSCACYFHLRGLFGKHNDEEVTIFALCAEHRGLRADLTPVTKIVMNIVKMSRILSRCHEYRHAPVTPG